ncbi:putative neutral zinc metallopeptidase [compost metagenome]
MQTLLGVSAKVQAARQRGERIEGANAIGDDRLQKQTRGQVVPDSFTHGTSAQRMRWFKLGFEHGQVGRCDTFQVARL